MFFFWVCNFIFGIFAFSLSANNFKMFWCWSLIIIKTVKRRKNPQYLHEKKISVKIKIFNKKWRLFEKSAISWKCSAVCRKHCISISDTFWSPFGPDNIQLKTFNLLVQKFIYLKLWRESIIKIHVKDHKEVRDGKPALTRFLSKSQAVKLKHTSWNMN